jgi:hypothetical protein
MEDIRRAGQNAEMMCDPTGAIRQCIILYAAHLADSPEQCLIAGVAKFRSPITTAGYHDLGSATRSPLHTHDHTLRAIKLVMKGRGLQQRKTTLLAFITRCRKFDLNGVLSPYWQHLPHVEPSVFLVCDILHQLHKFFIDHPFRWLQEIVGKDELDKRISIVQYIVRVRHFDAGVSRISQWSGREHRELQRIIVTICAGAPNVTPKLMRVLRSVMDMIYLAQYQVHVPSTLARIDAAIAMFHANKKEILRLKNILVSPPPPNGKAPKSGFPISFRIPKLEMMHNLVACIKQFSSLMQFMTDITEYLHILLVKTAWEQGNKKGSVRDQMCRYLDRMEKVEDFDDYHAWQEQIFGAAWQSEGDIEEIVLPNRSSHLTKKPSEASTSVDEAALRFGIPDLRAALADYYLFDLAGRNCGTVRMSLRNAPLPFDQVRIWYTLRIKTPPAPNKELSTPSTVSGEEDRPYPRPISRIFRLLSAPNIRSRTSRCTPSNARDGETCALATLSTSPMSYALSNLFLGFLLRKSTKIQTSTTP